GGGYGPGRRRHYPGAHQPPEARIQHLRPDPVGPGRPGPIRRRSGVSARCRPRSRDDDAHRSLATVGTRAGSGRGVQGRLGPDSGRHRLSGQAVRGDRLGRRPGGRGPLDPRPGPGQRGGAAERNRGPDRRRSRQHRRGRVRLTPPASIDAARAHAEGAKISPVSTFALILLVAGVLTAAAGVARMVVGGRGGSGPAPAGPTDWAGTAPCRPTRPGLVVGALLATLGVVLAGTGTVGLVTQSGRQSEDVMAAGDQGDPPSDPGRSTAPSETSTATGEASDSRGDAGPGTNCGMVLPAHGGPAQLQVKSGYIDCAEAERVV